MANVVEELKSEHAAIVALLNKVGELGLRSKEGQALLMSAKTGLLAHLKKEDDEFYPLLRKAAEKDKSLEWTLKMFAEDMNNITKKTPGVL